MRGWNTFFLFLFTVAGMATRGWSQSPASPSSEVLKLEDAVSMAMKDNRPVATAILEVEKALDDVSVLRTRRLPATDVTVFGSQLVTPVDFLFREGAFGRFPGIGPIPARDTSIRTPLRPSALVMASLTQPLSQLHKIGLGIQMDQMGTAIAREQLRLKQLSVVSDVKHAYYSLVEMQAARDATEESLKLYRELDRLVRENLEQQTALKADSLEVQTRLARTEYQALVLRQGLATQKEQLNLLLGRDIRTDFSVEPIPDSSPRETSLADAQAQALSRRPEIQEARLRISQSEFDQRLTKAAYIPDVSLRLSYVSFFNVEMLPKNVAALGLYANWEPFDWGRRKFELAQKVRTTRQANNQLKELESQILVEVDARFRKLEETRALLHVSELNRETARERLRVASDRFRLKAAQLKDVLSEQASLASADHDYAQALAGFWGARADFEKAVGEDQ